MYSSDQVDALRYSQMQSSIHNKTGSTISSNKSNLIAKFSHFQTTLNDIEADLHRLSADTKQSLRFAKQINYDVIGREMDQQKSKINQQVKKLDKLVKYGISESQKRSQKILADCKSRTNASEGLKNSLNALRRRINRMENTLGFQSITEVIL